jgi:prevent-host-death family protein
MRKIKITVTEAARNFADCVNRARYQNASFVLTKNGEAVAQIIPAKEKVCTGKELAEVLTKVRLSKREARAWRGDLKAARRQLKAPVDKWR